MVKKQGFTSLCVREIKENRTTQPHVLPIYATSSFSFSSIDEGMAIFKGDQQGHVYSRYGNPTIETVARKIALMESFDLDEDGECILFSSGMSAILTLMLSVLEPGHKILTQGNIYGGTTEQFDKILGKHGLSPVYTDLSDMAKLASLMAEDSAIRMVYLESPANPTLACLDLAALTEIAHKAGAYVCVDNTFCTPYLQRPLTHGVDFIVHSTTKYLNGHGNSTAGALVSIHTDLMKGPIWQAMKLAGTNCNPFDAWLLHNGMKTLPLRMDRHCANAMGLARFLESHPQISKVNYPGLESHPSHAIATQQMMDFGGMLSFEIKDGLEAGIAFMRKLKVASLAPTLGDIDTLVLHPASMSHINIDPEIRKENGISDGLIRLSVGIEDLGDLIDDLEQALS